MNLLDKYHFFYGDTSPFSNFYKTSFSADGQTFSTSEQAFMYKKAELFNDALQMKNVMLSSNPLEAKRCGRAVKGFSDAVWNKHKEKLMYDVCYAKFNQTESLRNDLLKTGSKTLVEASPVDKIWGIGLSYKQAKEVDPKHWGRNLLGKTLTRVRDDLLKKHGKPTMYVTIPGLPPKPIVTTKKKRRRRKKKLTSTI